jgi:hypothetical protein
MKSGAGVLKNLKATINMAKNWPEAQVTIGKSRKLSEEKDIQQFHYHLPEEKRGKRWTTCESIRTSL